MERGCLTGAALMEESDHSILNKTIRSSAFRFNYIKREENVIFSLYIYMTEA